MVSMASAVPWMLGGAWGVLLARPLLARAWRVQLAARALESHRVRVRARVRGGPSRRLEQWVRGSMVGRILARRDAAGRARTVARELPIMADVLGVAVSAGCTPYVAVVHAARWAPPTVSTHLRELIDAVEVGAGFVVSLDALAARVPPLRDTCATIAVATQVGSPLAPGLARIADEARRSARHRAEAHSRRVSVRLLFPLVFLVLPAFVLLTVVPGIAEGIGRP